jgi:hypothetical protein
VFCAIPSALGASSYAPLFVSGYSNILQYFSNLLGCGLVLPYSLLAMAIDSLAAATSATFVLEAFLLQLGRPHRLKMPRLRDQYPYQPVPECCIPR